MFFATCISAPFIAVIQYENHICQTIFPPDLPYRS